MSKWEWALASLIVGSLGVGIWALIQIWPQLSASIATYETLCEQARICRRADAATGVLNVVDGWGNPLYLNRKASEYSVEYTVISAGPDGKMQTEDDMSETATDFNKSRLLGGWIGRKGKEAAKGFMDGLAKDSKFKKE